MATTFEYPPAIARHRPFAFMASRHQEGRLRFAHHFFNTRFKILAHRTLQTDFTAASLSRVNDEVVCLIVSFFVSAG